MAKPTSVIMVGCLLSTGQLRWSKGLVIGNCFGHLLFTECRAELLCLWNLCTEMYLFICWIFLKYHTTQSNTGNTLTSAFNFFPTCHPPQNNMLILHHHLISPNSEPVTLHYTESCLNTSPSLKTYSIKSIQTSHSLTTILANFLFSTTTHTLHLQ